MTVRLGYKASAEQFAPRALVEFAVAAEDHGFDFVATSDHFLPWRPATADGLGGHAPFAFAWAAAVGERTHRVEIGTSVTTPTFRYNPAVVAQAVATLACLHPGRVWLGVGTGEALNEIAAGGVGHTLTAARLGIQAELCWTPGELNQMAKRIHRIGQTRPVTYSIAIAAGTIDDTMWTMITDKQHTLDAVLDGTPTTDADQTTNAAAEIAWQLSQAGLARIATA